MNASVRMRTRPQPVPSASSVPQTSASQELPLDPMAAAAGAEHSAHMSDAGVGYKRPPIQHQFKKGNRANPRGRPKGSKNIVTIIREKLGEKVKVREGGRMKQMSKAEIGVTKLVNKFAETGDLKHLVALRPYLMIDPVEAADQKLAQSSDPSTATVMAFLDDVLKNGATLAGILGSGTDPHTDGGSDDN
jgi:Family of unknown function (DUF5681)